MDDDIYLSDIFNDPNFHGLSEIERLKVLYTVDPQYRLLHPRDRWDIAKNAHLIPTPPATITPQESKE